MKEWSPVCPFFSLRFIMGQWIQMKGAIFMRFFMFKRELQCWQNNEMTYGKSTGVCNYRPISSWFPWARESARIDVAKLFLSRPANHLIYQQYWADLPQSPTTCPLPSSQMMERLSQNAQAPRTKYDPTDIVQQLAKALHSKDDYDLSWTCIPTLFLSQDKLIRTEFIWKESTLFESKSTSLTEGIFNWEEDKAILWISKILGW